MADIRAFRGYRYDLGRVGALSDVIAPPYDVIDAALQQQLYARSPYNVVRLILNQELPTDNASDNRYTRAAATLRTWLRDDVIRQDSARALYVVEQEFTVEGQTHVRRGFLARVRLEPFGTGQIYPHEETLAGPKADRLKLFQATHMNLSPVFGLYPDAEGQAMDHLQKAIGRALPLEARDHLGVVSRLWPVTDDHTVSAVMGVLGTKPVFIADGHHRYETGLRYLEERLAAGDAQDPEASPRFILMMLVSMTDPGLLILPTHRLVSGLPGWTADPLKKCLEPFFDVYPAASAPAVWEEMELEGEKKLLALGTVADGRWQLARLRDEQIMAKLAPQHSDAWRELAVSVLHVLVLDHLIAKAATSQPTCEYVHLVREVTEACHAKRCDLAVLVPPANMAHVEAIAGGLEKMPPKSTYFYPKLLSGLLFNSLKS